MFARAPAGLFACDLDGDGCIRRTVRPRVTSCSQAARREGSFEAASQSTPVWFSAAHNDGEIHRDCVPQ